MSASAPSNTSRSGRVTKRGTRHAGGRWRQIGRLVLFLFIVVVLVDALVGDQGFVARRRARHNYDRLAAELVQKKAENAALADEVRRLSSDPASIEELARRELNLMRPGEKVFIIKDLSSPASQ